MLRVRTIQAAACGVSIILISSPAMAWPIKWDPVEDLTGKPLHEHVEKGLKEAGNGIRDVVHEGEKLAKKAVTEVGNAFEDIRVLVTTGVCGGDLCDALDSVVKYAGAMIVDTGKSIENAGKRLSEGKIIDAVWHLQTDYFVNSSSNAAEAANRSTVLRAVGAVAASAYGGPAGAAAYGAWLTYESTDGNLELALRAGAIAGATAYAMNAVASDVDGIDIIKDSKIDLVVQNAAASGAIAGTAVALAGGDQQDIEQAITAGLVMSVIRDSYKELTTTDLTGDNLKASTGDPYCLNADPDGGLPCLPPEEAYVKNSDGSYMINDGKRVIDVTKLDARRPHVGMFAKGENDAFYKLSETSDPMVLVSKFPGMNAMAVGHDIFDIKFNPETTAALEMVVRVGTIAPAVVVTYEGAGYRVNELIRKEVIERNGDMMPAPPAGQAGAPEPVLAPPAAVEGQPPQQLADTTSAPDPVNDQKVATEFRNLVCLKEGSVRNTLLEIPLEPVVSDGRAMLCSIDRQTQTGWRHLWHAHYQSGSCIQKFNDIIRRNIEQGRRCYFSVGVRYDNTRTLGH